MTFGKLMREERLRCRMSLRTLGQALNRSAVYLSDIECGQRNPPDIAGILQIAKTLSTDATPLLRAAIAERKSVELQLPTEGSRRRELALALARAWDELDDDALETINQGILDQLNEQRRRIE